MNAYVNHKFKKGFVLGEESITKIHDLIVTRLRESSPEEVPKIKVYRTDNSVYLTEGLDDLRSEENAKRNKIRQIDFFVDQPDLILNLSFEYESSPSLKIEGTNRDTAFLLFSEIKEYLHTECLVLRRPLSDQKEGLFALMILIVAQLGLVIYLIAKSIFPSEKRALIEASMQSTDVAVKLNALLNDKLTTESEYPIVLGGMIGFIILICIIGYLIQKVFPSCVFYLGKEIEAYDRLKEMRSKWIWGIAISFGVSFVAGMVVWLLTRSS